MTDRPSIGVVIPTFRGANHLPRCLPPLLHSPLKPRLLVIDSSSEDGTAEVARSLGAEVLVIPRAQFNHGATRDQGRNYLGTAIVVMMTQDAYALSPDMLGFLVKPIVEGHASIAYARQLPHREASFLGAFARRFNYPPASHLRALKDKEIYGAYTFFCSNSCAAYCNRALDEIGGFPRVLFGEDTLAVAQLLHRFHRIAYVAEAQVYHSHDYTLNQEFRRHFDMGLVRRAHRPLLLSAGSDQRRGKAYLQALLSELWQRAPRLIPYALCQSAIKYLGYRLGGASLNAPAWIKRKWSSQPSYWQ